MHWYPFGKKNKDLPVATVSLLWKLPCWCSSEAWWASGHLSGKPKKHSQPCRPGARPQLGHRAFLPRLASTRLRNSVHYLNRLNHFTLGLFKLYSSCTGSDVSRGSLALTHICNWSSSVFNALWHLLFCFLLKRRRCIHTGCSDPLKLIFWSTCGFATRIWKILP